VGRPRKDLTAEVPRFDSAIDRTSPVPFYYQLQEILKQEIENGRWKPGDLLPSEAELAAGLGISRTVIRQALDVLEGDGQVLRVKGRGTTVAPPKFRYEAVAAARAWDAEDVAAKAVLSRVIEVRIVPAGARLGRLLEVHSVDAVCEVVCVEAIGATPIQLSQIYVGLHAGTRLARLIKRNDLPNFEIGGPEALTQLAERYAVPVRRSHVVVESAIANDFEAQQLGIRPRAPMFLLSSLALDAADRPLAFSRAVVRSDHFRFSVTIDHGHGKTLGDVGGRLASVDRTAAR
jgi:GntR family transcriptional regulator